MGQYFIIVNLDKQEMLTPSVFGDGAKFLEFSSKGNGVMQALAVLTSNGNGAGMNGDLDRMTYEGQPDFEPVTGERILSEWSTNHNPHLKFFDAEQYHKARVIVPAVMGHWAGDRIVTTGEYGDAYKYLTKSEQLRGCQRAVQDALVKARISAPLTTSPLDITEVDFKDVNLYDYACWFYTDISSTVKTQLALYDHGCGGVSAIEAQVRQMLADRLLSEFEHIKITGKGKNKRRKWDLRWLEYEFFDSLLLRQYEPEDLKPVKAWLRAQILLPWQRRLLVHYKGFRIRASELVLQDEFITRRIAEGLPTISRAKYDPLLPSAQYLAAAIAIEKQVAATADETIITDGVDATRIAEKMGVAARQRVINIDK